MRHLRVLVAVAQCGSVTRATSHLHLTQSAITRTVRALEDRLGLELFERSARGMVMTACGKILVSRVHRALDYLAAADREGGTGRSLADKVSKRHLLTVSAIADWQTETRAAAQMGVSQPAVTVALRDLEELLGQQVFLRTASGMVPTSHGEIVIRGAKLALNEIAAAQDDLAAHLGLVRGRLMVGALPLTGTQAATSAVCRVARLYPELRLSVIEAPFDVLLKGLRCGDFDVIVGALHPHPPSDVTQEKTADDVLSVVARHNHPLTARTRLSLSDLGDVEWVVPFRRTSLRNTIEKAMQEAGVSFPEDAIEANTVAMVRGLLVASDRLSVLSRRQVLCESGDGLLAVLPIDLPGTGFPIGFITRTDALHSVGLDALLAQLREDLKPAATGGVAPKSRRRVAAAVGKDRAHAPRRGAGRGS